MKLFSRLDPNFTIPRDLKRTPPRLRYLLEEDFLNFDSFFDSPTKISTNFGILNSCDATFKLEIAAMPFDPITSSCGKLQFFSQKEESIVLDGVMALSPTQGGNYLPN